MPSENEELARVAYAALNDRDLEAFLQIVHPDVTFNSLIAEAEGRTYRGHEGLRVWWDDVASALGGVNFEMTDFHDFGDRAYADLVVSVEVSDVEIPQRMFQAFRVRDGKASWWQTCRTENEARQVLGVEG